MDTLLKAHLCNRAQWGQIRQRSLEKRRSDPRAWPLPEWGCLVQGGLVGAAAGASGGADL